MPRRDLLKIRNFGQKSLDELYERLEEKGFWSPDEPAGSADEETPSEDGSEEIAAVVTGESENEA